jgi:hypothetical protein
MKPTEAGTDMENFCKDLERLQDHFKVVMDEMEQEQESYWSGLTPHQQLLVFCAVVRRICKGELEDGRSYRGVLYSTFGWGPEAYMPAQLAGYLELHNAIMQDNHERQLLEAFCKQQGIQDAKDKIDDWFSHY